MSGPKAAGIDSTFILCCESWAILSLNYLVSSIFFFPLILLATCWLTYFLFNYWTLTRSCLVGHWSFHPSPPLWDLDHSDRFRRISLHQCAHACVPQVLFSPLYFLASSTWALQGTFYHDTLKWSLYYGWFWLGTCSTKYYGQPVDKKYIVSHPVYKIITSVLLRLVIHSKS